MEDDLELFTNTQFYDFDSGQQTDFQAQPVKAGARSAAATTNTASENITTAPPSAIGDMPNLDFSMTGESDISLSWLSHAPASLFVSHCQSSGTGRLSYSHVTQSTSQPHH